MDMAQNLDKSMNVLTFSTWYSFSRRYQHVSSRHQEWYYYLRYLARATQSTFLDHYQKYVGLEIVIWIESYLRRRTINGSKPILVLLCSTLKNMLLIFPVS